MTRRASAARAIVGLFCWWIVPTSLGLAAEPLPRPTFDAPGPIATVEGHATLGWSAETTDRPIRAFELQESSSADFATARTRYRGPDRASFVSGLAEGTTWFRVRAVEDDRHGAWSEPLAIEVDYASRATLLPLLALGALVFAATLATVVAGHRRHRVPTH